MPRSLFGTDGVRGEANSHPMTAELALRIGAAAGNVLRSDAGTNRVVIGKDTRNSSYMFENALTAGFTSTGMDVFLLGPVPTPAVGMLTRSMRAEIGVMISASHNAFRDNGIKFFGRDGFKLLDDAEAEIEARLAGGVILAVPENIGQARRIDDGLGRYMEFAKTTFNGKKMLDGLRVVVDCANGAAYRAAPEVLWELGADVVELGVSPNGYNINEKCGSTYPRLAADAVLERRADVAICLDGDADRIIVVDEKGHVASGDQIMALIACAWKRAERLSRDAIVTSIMSNKGLEHHLAGIGLSVIRADVGDRYVVETMRREGCNFGGEQSGHIVMTDFMTTGDGLIAGLQVLSAVTESGRPASELCRQFDPLPQLLENVRYGAGRDPLEAAAVKSSGHIVMTDFMTTGDGLIAGLQVLSAVTESGRPASELCRQFDPLPQLLENVRYGAGRDPLEAAAVKSAFQRFAPDRTRSGIGDGS